MDHKGSYEGRKLDLGFTPGPLHGYLGHFANEEFLREGHNYVPKKAAKKGAKLGMDVAKKGVHVAGKAGKFGIDVAKKAGKVAGNVAKKTASFFSFGLFGDDRPKKEPRGSVARIKQRAEGIRSPGHGFKNPEKKKAFIQGTKRLHVAREAGRSAVAYQKSQGVKEARHAGRVEARSAGEGHVRKAGRVAARGQRDLNRPAVKEMRTAARADIKARKGERAEAMAAPHKAKVARREHRAERHADRRAARRGY